jgi:hypothetical protein
MPDIFISYRRQDSSGYAGRLYDQVSAHFGPDHVFMDVTAIEPGSDFAEVIDKKVGTCDALVALIGPNWLTVKDEQSRPRLGAPGDFVSVEIAAALKRNIEVIPVLVAGAKMPRQLELPAPLQPLARRQALELSDARFSRDIVDLIAALETPPGQRTPPPRRWAKSALWAAILLLCAVAAGVAMRSSPPASLPSPPPAAVKQDVTGKWKAVLQRDDVKFDVYFTFEVVGDKLFGKVIYPTGEAGILDGTVSPGRISFRTKHRPDFSDEETVMSVDGTVADNEILIRLQSKDSFAKGAAHRVAP